ncbi:MAG TPA: metalloregulator ArsR/SmtB family transcription factor [Armatimonadota bacterium]|jgi:ArsR family transcriptional regulator
MSKEADVFKALGDPVRMRIVRMLADSGEMCVCKIIAELESMSQPAVSHHLGVLKSAGLVCPRKEGLWIYYSLSESTLRDVALASIQHLLNMKQERCAVRAGDFDERVGEAL